MSSTRFSAPVAGFRGHAPRRAAVRSVATSASSRRPHPRNVAGSLFVDETCIDCDTCRWMSPDLFRREESQSVVYRQPDGQAQEIEAMKAVLSCPTHSIHFEGSSKDVLHRAHEGLPSPVEGAEGVYHCGWHSEKSYGAASYLVVRREGNVLIDSPRYNPILAKSIERLGGVKHMFLTHQDDVADHDKWAAHFGCSRILHEADVRGSTAAVEVQLRGDGPWDLEGNALPADTDADVQLIFTPGHTRGCVCLLHAPSASLFTGDHLAFSARLGRLSTFRRYNWFDVELQAQSAAKLADVPFLNLLPGHGRQHRFADAGERKRMIAAALEEEAAGVY
ncbi:unnamed protein product [Pedinophyceae sp. YPF-701]|nr:unnamed protein product [Pedinophyceae sp. YPF-701]